MKASDQLAIDALHKQIQVIAVDANLWDAGIAQYPYAETCSKRKRELEAAIKVIEVRGRGVQLAMEGILT